MLYLEGDVISFLLCIRGMCSLFLCVFTVLILFIVFRCVYYDCPVIVYCMSEVCFLFLLCVRLMLNYMVFLVTLL